MKYKLICFDVDGTLISGIEFIWQHIHDFFGTDNSERKEWKRKYYEKEITYGEWASHDIKMWKEVGATKEKLIESIKDVKLVDGARETISELKKMGLKIGVISGSIDFVLDYVFPNHPFDFIYMNKIVFNDDGTIKKVIPTMYDFEEKATALKDEAKLAKCDLSETVFVGDHFNDVDVAKIAGLSIAFNAKDKELIEISDYSTNENLKKILEFIKQS